jgi:Glycosyltransferase family 87
MRGRVALVAVCLGLVLYPFLESDREVMNSDWTGVATIAGLATAAPSRMYDREAQREQQLRLTHGGAASQQGQDDGLLPVVSPPWVGFLGVPFLALGPAWGGRLFGLFQLLALAAGLTLLAGPRRFAAVVPALAGVPAALMLANMQLDGMVVLGLGLAVALQRRNLGLWGGLALGLTLVKPHLVLAIGPGLLLARQWRLLAGWLASGLLLVGTSLLVRGNLIASWLAFIQHNARRIGEDISLPGLVGPSLVVPATLLALAVVLGLAYRRRHDQTVAAGILIAGGLLCAPHALATDTLMIGAGLLMAGRPGWKEWLVLSLAAAALALNHQPLLTALLGVATIGGFLIRLSLPGWPVGPSDRYNPALPQTVGAAP